MYLIAFRLARVVRLSLFIALLAGGVAFVSAAPAAPDEWYKLSSDGPLPIGGDVQDFKVSPNGVYTVYRAGQDVADMPQLYAVRNDGSQPPVKLSALPRRGQYVADYAISPDNAHVVYTADQDTRDVVELYSAPLDGSAAPVKLNGPLVEGGTLYDYIGAFHISPDGSRVVYRADQEMDDVQELYVAPVDGSAAAEKLNGPLPDGGGTYAYAITPDSQYLLYTADQDTNNVTELYRCLLYTSPSPRDGLLSRMPSSA